MKTPIIVLWLFVSIILTGCVTERQIYGKYTDYSCENKNVYLAPSPWVTAVYFDFDAYVLNQNEMKKLEKNISILSAYPNMNVALIGHADPFGTNKYNFDLSKRRANEISSILIKSGISNNRIKQFGAGEMNTIKTTFNRMDNKVNRRVEMILLDQDMFPVTVGFGSDGKVIIMDNTSESLGITPHSSLLFNTTSGHLPTSDWSTADSL